MDTTMKTIELTLPDSELSFIKTIAKEIRMDSDNQTHKNSEKS